MEIRAIKKDTNIKTVEYAGKVNESTDKTIPSSGKSVTSSDIILGSNHSSGATVILEKNNNGKVVSAIVADRNWNVHLLKRGDSARWFFGFVEAYIKSTNPKDSGFNLKDKNGNYYKKMGGRIVEVKLDKNGNFKWSYVGHGGPLLDLPLNQNGHMFIFDKNGNFIETIKNLKIR